MANGVKKKTSNKFTYLIIFLLILLTCTVAVLFALNMNEEQIIKIQKATGIEFLQPKNNLPLTTTTLEIPSDRMKLDSPFELNEEKNFRLDSNITYYVKDKKAFSGESEDLYMRIYVISYKGELFAKQWMPNLENMAEVTVTTLKKTSSIKNVKTKNFYFEISGNSAVEVISNYTLHDKQMVQRVLHIAKGHTTWTVETTYEETNRITNTVNQIFGSIVIR